MNTQPPSPLLVADGLTKTFGQGHTAVHALNDVSLQVEPGEFVLIMGPSGSGKTTLLSILGGLMRPTSGQVVVAGEELTAMGQRELTSARRRLIGFIFQSFNLLSALSVQENVELVLDIAGVGRGEARKRARASLSALGLGDRLGFRPRALSDGEQQRVSIARALANEPGVILADEPTANLDSARGHEVMQLLKELAVQQGRAVLVVSHDNRIREVADRVLWLEDGRIRTMGKLHQDPVCGMSVDEERAVSIERDSERLFFCSTGCRDQYLTGR